MQMYNKTLKQTTNYTLLLYIQYQIGGIIVQNTGFSGRSIINSCYVSVILCAVWFCALPAGYGYNPVMD